MAKLSIRDLDLAGKRVFVRVDFNVPIKDGVIGDDTRIRSSLPTIRYALDHGATVVLASHLGRPKGQASPQLSLRPIATRLSELLGRPVAMAEDCVGDRARRAVEEAASVRRSRRAPREPSLSPRRGEERCGLRGRARLAGGPVRQRCVRRGAPGACVGRRYHASFAACGGRIADGAGVEVPRPCARIARTPVRGDSRRREGVRQAGSDREHARQGRPSPDRRRDGLYVFQIARRPDRQVARRGRQAGRGAPDRGQCC